MITLNELCAHLLPPEEHLKFKTLILDEQRIILVATMSAPRQILERLMVQVRR